MSARIVCVGGGLLLAFLLPAGCADLEVVNLNEPDREQVAASAEEAVALVSGSFNGWFRATFPYVGGSGLFLSQAAFQHASPWSCGTEVYSRIPRVAFANDPGNAYYANISQTWVKSYAAISAAATGLGALDDPDVVAHAGDEELARGRAFALFNLGLAHATVALLYDMGAVVDQTVDLKEAQPLLGYSELLAKALQYLDGAIQLSEGAEFTLPFGWMQAPMTSEALARLAHSLKARFRAQVARTPQERQGVDWAAVVADVDAGLEADHLMSMDPRAGWDNGALTYSTHTTWSQLPYFVYGMADQSGSYQTWIALELSRRSAWLPDGRPALIVTPDLRFPQGGDVESQRQRPGRYFHIMSAIEEGNTWKRPDNGSWRWSWYKPGPKGTDYVEEDAFLQPLVTLAEMRLLKAEGLYRLGDRGGAAALVNESRTAAGLSPTDAGGTSQSCVPRLPDGSCGDLWEMLKWEKRMETTFTGIGGAGWWFDSRGWGDLWKNTPLQIPVPCHDLKALRVEPCHTFGGPGGEMGSPGSRYQYPFESSTLGIGFAEGLAPGRETLPPWCDGPQVR